MISVLVSGQCPLYAGPAPASAALGLEIVHPILPLDNLVGIPNAPVLADVGRLRKLSVLDHPKQRGPTNRYNAQDVVEIEYLARLTGLRVFDLRFRFVGVVHHFALSALRPALALPCLSKASGDD